MSMRFESEILHGKSTSEERLISQYFKVLLLRSHISLGVFNRFIDMLNSGTLVFDETQFAIFFRDALSDYSPSAVASFQCWYYEHIHPYNGQSVDLTTEFQLIEMRGKTLVRPRMNRLSRWMGLEFQRILTRETLGLPMPEFTPLFVPSVMGADHPLPVAELMPVDDAAVPPEDKLCLTIILRRILAGGTALLVAKDSAGRLCDANPTNHESIRILLGKFCVAPEAFGQPFWSPWFQHVARTFTGSSIKRIPFFQDENGMIYPPEPTIRAIALAELIRVWSGPSAL